MSNSDPQFVKDAVSQIRLYASMMKLYLDKEYNKEKIVEFCDSVREGLDLIEESL